MNLYKRQISEWHHNEIKGKIEDRQMKEDWISRQRIKKLEQSNKWKKIESNFIEFMAACEMTWTLRCLECKCVLPETIWSNVYLNIIYKNNVSTYTSGDSNFSIWRNQGFSLEKFEKTHFNLFVYEGTAFHLIEAGNNTRSF